MFVITIFVLVVFVLYLINLVDFLSFWDPPGGKDHFGFTVRRHRLGVGITAVVDGTCNPRKHTFTTWQPVKPIFLVNHEIPILILQLLITYVFKSTSFLSMFGIKNDTEWLFERMMLYKVRASLEKNTLSSMFVSPFRYPVVSRQFMRNIPCMVLLTCSITDSLSVCWTMFKRSV